MRYSQLNSEHFSASDFSSFALEMPDIFEVEVK